MEITPDRKARIERAANAAFNYLKECLSDPNMTEVLLRRIDGDRMRAEGRKLIDDMGGPSVYAAFWGWEEREVRRIWGYDRET